MIEGGLILLGLFVRVERDVVITAVCFSWNVFLIGTLLIGWMLRCIEWVTMVVKWCAGEGRHWILMNTNSINTGRSYASISGRSSKKSQSPQRVPQCCAALNAFIFIYMYRCITTFILSIYIIYIHCISFYLFIDATTNNNPVVEFCKKWSWCHRVREMYKLVHSKQLVRLVRHLMY